MAYVGQTGRSFTIWYNKHKRAYRNNNHTSRFAQHLNEQVHSFGSINIIMQIVHYHKEGTHLNTIERFYIHAEHAANNQMNDSHTIFPNTIFDTLLKAHHP
jgi:hypothetical protein